MFGGTIDHFVVYIVHNFTIVLCCCCWFVNPAFTWHSFTFFPYYCSNLVYRRLLINLSYNQSLLFLRSRLLFDVFLSGFRLAGRYAHGTSIAAINH